MGELPVVGSENVVEMGEPTLGEVMEAKHSLTEFEGLLKTVIADRDWFRAGDFSRSSFIARVNRQVESRTKVLSSLQDDGVQLREFERLTPGIPVLAYEFHDLFIGGKEPDKLASQKTWHDARHAFPGELDDLIEMMKEDLPMAA